MEGNQVNCQSDLLSPRSAAMLAISGKCEIRQCNRQRVVDGRCARQSVQRSSAFPFIKAAASAGEEARFVVDPVIDKEAHFYNEFSHIIGPGQYQKIVDSDISFKNPGKYDDSATKRDFKNAPATFLDVLEVHDANAEFEYQKYRVKKNFGKQFFQKNCIFSRHHPDKGGTFKCTCAYHSEELVLLVVETLRNSDISIKRRLIKQMETGLQVLLGPWWHLALLRVLDVTRVVRLQDLDNYTCVKMFKSLCFLVSDGIHSVMHNASNGLTKLRDQYGVDLVTTVWEAARIIHSCGGENHPLNQELVVLKNFIANYIPDAQVPWGRSPSKMCIFCPKRPVQCVIIPCG